MTIIHRSRNTNNAQHVAPRVVPPAAVWDVDSRSTQGRVQHRVGAIGELRTMDSSGVSRLGSQQSPQLGSREPDMPDSQSAAVAGQARIEAVRNVVLGAVFGLLITVATIAFSDGGENTPIVPANYTPNAVTSMSHQ